MPHSSNNSDYYGELAAHTDPARAVGWESRSAQRARFEFVRGHIQPGDRVLDLGAGLGDLGRYLIEHGWAGDYLGVERDPRLHARGATREPRVALVHRDLFEGDARADVVAAIGVLVDGSSLRSDGLRFARLRSLIDRVTGATERVGIIIVLDQDGLEAHPILREEAALGGMRRAELPWLAPTAELVTLSSLELAILIRPAPSRRV